MEELRSFIRENLSQIDVSNNKPTAKTIENAEKMLEIQFGDELKMYLEEFGYLGFKFVELCGLNEKQQMKSDLIITTQRIRKQFEKTENLIVIENIGDNDYILCDSNDEIFEFISENNKFIKLNKKLSNYILNRFCSII